MSRPVRCFWARGELPLKYVCRVEIVSELLATEPVEYDVIKKVPVEGYISRLTTDDLVFMKDEEKG